MDALFRERVEPASYVDLRSLRCGHEWTSVNRGQLARMWPGESPALKSTQRMRPMLAEGLDRPSTARSRVAKVGPQAP